MKKKVASFVTGANGFVGSHLVDYLLEKGEEVHAIVRSTSNLQWLDGRNVKIHTCGLNRSEKLKPIFEGADYIYHIAGIVKVPTKDGFIKGNVDMTRNVMEAAAANSRIKRVLITSSMAATGPAKLGESVDETSPLRPIEPYGESKVAQESLAQEYADRVSSTIVRPPGIYGPRDTEIFAFFKAINKGIRPTIGSGPKEMSLIHVRDLVEGMYQAATNEKAAGQIYFMGSMERYNWKQLGVIASEVMGNKTRPVKIPHFVIFGIGFVGQFLESTFGMDIPINKDRAYRMTRPSWYCSSKKAADELGFKQTISIEEGFKKTVEWYREMGWLK
jgi:dihydroflavonol-4-reductase